MKIKKIPENILDAVRQRLGADDENDTSRDQLIEKMTPKELMAKWSGWHLGYEDWGNEIINKYEHLKKLEQEGES
jgi:hypothetical protein